MNRRSTATRNNPNQQQQQQHQMQQQQQQTSYGQPKQFLSSGYENNFTGTTTSPALTRSPQQQQQQQQQTPVKSPVAAVAKPAPAVIKSSPVVPQNAANAAAAAAAADMDMETFEEDDEDEGGDETKGSRKPWFREGTAKKKPSVRQKRLKRNRSLRKLLTPKNALMALYELKGNELSEFQMQSDEKGFVATVSVNGKEFSGRGISKIIAKTDASEKALRDLIISKMQAIPKGGGNAALAAALAGSGGSGDGGSANDGDAQDDAMNAADEQEEVPMMHLASFALHKLFTEWQADGFEIPDFRAGPVAAVKVETPKPTERKELPTNHEQLHPSMLLAIMRPQTQYIELGSEGTTPNVIHRVGVTVNGEEFVGAARSKKAARKAAATQACNKLFKCAYVMDGAVEVPVQQQQPQQQQQQRQGVVA